MNEDEMMKKYREMERQKPIFLHDVFMDDAPGDRIRRILRGCSIYNSNEREVLEQTLMDEEDYFSFSGAYEVPKFLNMIRIEEECPELDKQIRQFLDGVFEKAEEMVIPDSFAVLAYAHGDE